MSEKRCPTCNGNDTDAPCAYPSEGRTGCLRDARLRAVQQRQEKAMKKAIALLALAASCTARAEYYTGNDLLRFMRGSTVEQANAYGYITGVNDALHRIMVCVPNAVTVSQLNDVVRNYLEANPQIRHLAADGSVAAALGIVWPCPKKGSGA